MNRKRLQQVILGSVGAAVLAGGALLAAAEYQAGHEFAPTESDRALNVNQVVFPDEEKQQENIDRSQDDNSEMWEKDRDAEENEQPRDNGNADYLFESSQVANSDGSQSGALNNGSVSADASGADIVYDVTRNSSSADVILKTGDGASAGENAENGTETKENGKNNTNTAPDSKADNGGVMAPATPAPTPQPDPMPPGGATADRVKDPVIAKPAPDPGQYTYSEAVKDNLDEKNIDYAFVFTKLSDTNSFYVGQKLTAKEIFSSMDAYIMRMDDFGAPRYYLTDEDYGKYLLVDAVTFDGGKTWVSDFPVTIPEGMNMGNVGEESDFRIKYRYRLTTKEDWAEKTVSISTVGTYRVMVLGQPLAPNATQVDEENIINSPYDQYGPLNDQISLLSYMEKLLTAQNGIAEDGTLTKLAAGWTEDGELVPWFYTATPGRHILEPTVSTNLDTDLYQVELLNRWIDPDLTVYRPGELSSFEAQYAQLQTLTNYKGATATDEAGHAYLRELTVPDYIQAVSLLYQPNLTVGTLNLPDSVLFVNTAGLESADLGLQDTSCLEVKDAYVAGENNPRYTSVDGVLYNKEETIIEGVPTGRTELDVPDTVSQVKLPYGNHLQTVTLNFWSTELLPDIDYTMLPENCSIAVDGALMDDYLRAAAGELQSTTLHVSAIDNPGHRYRVRDDLAVNDAGMLHLVLTDAKRWTDLPEYVHGLEADALRDSGIVTIMLPKDGSAFAFDADCFDAAEDLKVIGCYSKAQYDAAAEAVKASGRDIEVVKMYGDQPEAADGWIYLAAEDGNLLLQAPKTLEEFDGYIPLEDGSKVPVTAIADGVFQNCENLTWVTLPEETIAIGYQAFKGCTNLQGVLIGEAESITIGQQAFDDCPSLRFVASNAKAGYIECEDFALRDSMYSQISYLLCLENASYYNQNWTHFEDDGDGGDIQAFELKDCGGTKVLYGVNSQGEEWIALRSGGMIDGAVDLSSDTQIIYSTSFKDAQAVNGSFTVNWDGLQENLWLLGFGAFENSAVGDNIVLPEDTTAGQASFENCDSLISIEFPGHDIELYDNVVSYCDNLEKVTYGSIYYGTGLWTDSYYGCTNLKEIEFTGAQAPKLVLHETGARFDFNSMWYSDWSGDNYTLETEASHLHLSVPAEYQQDYIEEWRCPMMGYPDSSGTSGYQNLWTDVRTELTKQNDGVVPGDDVIRTEVDKRLLESENRIRTLMGIPTVSSIDHQYSYTIDANGDVTLTDARDVEFTELTSAELDLPAGKGVAYIASGAFRHSPQLSTVFLTDDLKGIYSNAFEGVTDPKGGYLMLVRSGDSIPQLLLTEEGTPFRFGLGDTAEEEGSLVEVVDMQYGSTDYDSYIQAWTLPMAGYYSVDNLRKAVTESLTKDGEAPSEEAVETEVVNRLRAAENRVRAVLGCQQLEENAPITYRGLTAAAYAGTSQTQSMATPESAALPVAGTESDPAETPAKDEEAARDQDAADRASDPQAPATPETAQAG